MNNYLVAVFLAALVPITGCVSLAPEDSGCAGATVRRINIVYQRHSKITVAPPSRYASPGDAIEYRVKGPEARLFNSTGTSGPGSFAWLDASGPGNSRGNSYFVCVPKNANT